MPMTAKMKMMIQRTKVRFPRAPMVFPIMEMRRLSVGQDLANLNTLSWGRMVGIKLMVVAIVDCDEDDSELEQFRASGILNSRPVQSGIRIKR